MKIKVKRTDRRHTGSDQFQFYIEIKKDTWDERFAVREQFYELRLWCWDTWGPSRELNQYSLDFLESVPKDLNKNWSWLNDEYRQRLYLATRDEAALFTLKWA